MLFQSPKLFEKHIALPQDHGSWVFLFSPLLIGIFTSPRVSFNLTFVVLGALAGFLLRQPTTIVVKAISGRRSKSELHPAIIWMCIYAAIGSACLVTLIIQGNAFVAYLLLPGVLVFLWHLYLISRRAERRKLGVEIVGSGVLALSAPAAHWVNAGELTVTGWMLFLLTWLQSAASIVYAYLRLAQRELTRAPSFKEMLSMGWRASLYSSFNLILSALLPMGTSLPRYLCAAYALQWLETCWGITHPAMGIKPTRIGIRQLIVSTLFTIIFILSWRL